MGVVEMELGEMVEQDRLGQSCHWSWGAVDHRHGWGEINGVLLTY